MGAGDRVALDLPNSVDFLVAALACIWVGAMFIPLAVSDPVARVAGIVADCDPALVPSPRGRPEPTCYARSGADRLAATGRSGHPVGAGRPRRPALCHLHVGHDRSAQGGGDRTGPSPPPWCTVANLGIDQATRAICVSPFHFDGSFATLFPVVVAGGSLVIPPRDSLLFARFFFRALTREQITHTGFSSSYLRLLLASPHLEAFTGLRR